MAFCVLSHASFNTGSDLVDCFRFAGFGLSYRRLGTTNTGSSVFCIPKRNVDADTPDPVRFYQSLVVLDEVIGSKAKT